MYLNRYVSNFGSEKEVKVLPTMAYSAETWMPIREAVNNISIAYKPRRALSSKNKFESWKSAEELKFRILGS